MSARPTEQINNDAGHEADHESGFSLLETIFALAIMSLASVALFQSTTSMLTLSERAVAAGERTVSDGLDRLALTNLIDGLLPHHPSEAGSAFTGSERQFSGLTTGALNADIVRPEKVVLSLRAIANGTDALVYTSSLSPKGWELMAGLPQGIRFEYMGVDHNWYSLWPPQIPPRRGFYDDEKLLPSPSLPEAIRAKNNEFVLWTARVSRVDSAL